MTEQRLFALGDTSAARPQCMVIATLGTAPAVLTELLYALTLTEGYEVLGLEIHTTTEGKRRFAEAYAEGAWSRLKASLRAGGLDDVLLAWDLPLPGVLAPKQVIDAAQAGGRPITIEVLDQPQGPLSDIRLTNDALALERRLFERVRTLANGLPAQVTLVGSLAGGRKTMSASLQTVFSLAARPGDRLVHVLLHPQVEALSIPKSKAKDAHGEFLPEYVAPTAAWAAATGVPESEQITLYDVHFPVLRALLADATGSHQKGVVDVIKGAPFADYCHFTSEVRRLGGLSPEGWRAHVAKCPGGRWLLELRHPDVPERVERIELSPSCGVAFVALAERPGLDAVAMVRLLSASGYDGCSKQMAQLEADRAGAHEDAGKYWSKVRSRLEKTLLASVIGRDVGLGAFAVVVHPAGTGHQISAATQHRVHYDYREIRTGHSIADIPTGAGTKAVTAKSKPAKSKPAKSKPTKSKPTRKGKH